MSGSILICMTNPACSVLVGRAGLACHSRHLSLWFEHFWQSVMLIVLRIVLPGEEKERHFYFCTLSIYRRGGISEGTENVFNCFLIYLVCKSSCEVINKFSILNLIVTHSVPVFLGGKYWALKLESRGVYCFDAHHSFFLWAARWWVLPSGLCCACMLLAGDIVVLWQVLTRGLMPGEALLDTHCSGAVESAWITLTWQRPVVDMCIWLNSPGGTIQGGGCCCPSGSAHFSITDIKMNHECLVVGFEFPRSVLTAGASSRLIKPRIFTLIEWSAIKFQEKALFIILSLLLFFSQRRA